jgi:phage minor structural protein
MIINILHHQRDEIIGWVSEVFTDTHKHSITNEETYYFEAPSQMEDMDKIAKRNRLLIKGEDGEFREFIVHRTIDETTKGVKEVSSRGSFVDLNKLKWIVGQVRDGETVKSAAEYVLLGLPWKLGVTEYSGIRKWTIDKHIGAYDALKEIASLFECELRFRVTISGYKITGRYVDFLKKQGANRNEEVVFGDDLLSLKRIVDTDNLITALKCIGPERDDGSRLEVTVTDDAAYQNWNYKGYHLVGMYEPKTSNPDITEEELEELGEVELKKRISAAVDYEIEASALDGIKRLGDTLKIKDEHFNPPIYLESRVIYVERSIFDKSKKTLRLGEVIEFTEEEVFKDWKYMQSLYGFKQITSPTPPVGRSNIEWVQTGTSQGIGVSHYWDTINEVWKKTTPTEAPEVNSYSQTDIDSKDIDAYEGSTIYTDQRFTNDEVLSNVEVSPNGNILPKNGKRITTQRLAAEDEPLEGNYLNVEEGKLVSYKDGSSRTLVSMRDTIPKTLDGNKRYGGGLEPEAYGKMFCYRKEFLIPSAGHQLGDVYSYTVNIPDYTLVAISDVLSIQLTTESVRFSANVRQNSLVTDGTDLMSFDIELTPTVDISGAFTIPVYITIIGTR